MNAFLLTYVSLFGTAAIACLVSAYWFWKITREDTARGNVVGESRNALLALQLTSAGWAATTVGAFLAPTPGLERAFYLSGMVLGIAAVGAWLWFCSAYSGRTLHREKAVQRIALVTFLFIVGTKLTNAWHGLYFSTESAQYPFPHLELHYHGLYWVSVGLSYALAAVGYFMLFELFGKVGSRGGKLGLLTGVTAIPLLFNGLGEGVPWLLNVSHEPLGVAVFALGVTFLYRDHYRAVEVAGDRQSPVFVLETNGKLLDYNQSAADLFPEIVSGENVMTRPLSEVVPAVARALEGGQSVVQLQKGSEQRYYHIGLTAFALQRARPCQALLLTDVTERFRMHKRLLEVQEEERRRIDQEIHNEVGGLLASLQLIIDSARIEVREQDATTQHFTQMEETVSKLSTALRLISRKRYPGTLSEQDLAEALSSLIGDMEKENGLNIDLILDIESEDRLSTLHKRTAYWIVQEALINVARHAETSEAKVLVFADEKQLSLQVIDDGVGFDPFSQDGEESFGIEGIRRRAERLNGEFEINSIPDEGTRICTTLPLNSTFL